MSFSRVSVLKKSLITGTLFLAGLLSFGIVSSYVKVPVLIVDEAFYAEVANRILDGDISYRNNKPPGIFFIYAAVFRFFGNNNLYAVHIAAALSLILTGVSLYFLVASIHCRLAGLLSAVTYMLLPTFNRSPSNYFAANTEIFMMLTITLSLLCFVKGRNRKSLLFLSGLLSAISTMLKQPAMILIPFYILYIFLSFFSTDRNTIKAKLIETGTILFGFFAGLAPFLFLFWYKGALEDLFYNLFTVNRFYFGQIPIINGLETGYYMTRNTQLPGKELLYLAIFTQFIFYCRLLFKKALWQKNSSNYPLFFVLWSCMSVYCLSIGWRFSGHYYYMTYPVLAALFGAFWSNAVLFLFTQQKWRKNIVRIPCLSIIFFIILVSLGYPLKKYTGFPPAIRRLVTYLEINDPTTNAIKHTANYITAHTTPRDRLFVWGYCPEIYLLSGRRCATRYVHCDFLVGDVDPYLAGPRPERIKAQHWNELFSDFSRTMPVYIIDVSPTNYICFGSNSIDKFPALKTFLYKYYYVEKKIGDIVLYRINKPDISPK